MEPYSRSQKEAEGHPLIGVPQEVIGLAKRAAQSHVPILIEGAPGTSKWGLANFIHQHCDKKDQPIIYFHCASSTTSADPFTEAFFTQSGLREEERIGTLILDHIEQLSPADQTKLEALLKAKEPIGRIRVIALTSISLRSLVEEARFKADLFYALSVIHLRLPRLAEHPDLIPQISREFIEHLSFNRSLSPFRLSLDSEKALQQWGWPENHDELRRSLEAAILRSTTGLLRLDDFHSQHTFAEKTLDRSSLPVTAGVGSDLRTLFQNIYYYPTIHELVKAYTDFILERNAGARDKTAKVLGIDRKTLYRRLQSMRGQSAPKSLGQNNNGHPQRNNNTSSKAQQN